MIQKIITQQTKEGREMLSYKADPVDLENLSYLRDLSADLIDTAKSCTNPTAAGLAAHQIGHPVRAFAIKWGSRYRVLFNPEIIEASEKKAPFCESCLSRPARPGIWTKRHKTIRLRFYELGESGFPRFFASTEKFKKLDAIVVQHELDHLNGILI